MSSIIHSYCALESAINEIGYAAFFEEDSALYVNIQNRVYTLRKTIANWKTVSCIDKLLIIVESLSGTTIPNNQIDELRELNNLRNWLVHGFVFKSTVLLEQNPSESGTYTQVDREDSINWSQQFRLTKFNSIDELDVEDARKALIIVLRILQKIMGIENKPIILTNYIYGPCTSVFWPNDTLSGANMIDQHLAKALDKASANGPLGILDT